MAESLTMACDMLSTYGGRDKVIRTACYSSKLIAAVYSSKNPDLASKFSTFGSKMSQCRATLRLFDDLPMLNTILNYGLGKTEPSLKFSVLGVLSNIVDALYYPIDKICWLADNKLISVKNQTLWDMLSSLFWLLSNYLNLIRNLMVLKRKPDRETSLKVNVESVNKFRRKLILQYVTITRNFLDIIHAGSTLPKGVLWGSQMKAWKVSLIGTISSLLGIYQFILKYKL